MSATNPLPPSQICPASPLTLGHEPSLPPPTSTNPATRARASGGCLGLSARGGGLGSSGCGGKRGAWARARGRGGPSTSGGWGAWARAQVGGRSCRGNRAVADVGGRRGRSSSGGGGLS
ncbi:hypothetical protein TIFTF001_019504 [Ficus carica]|uniref:Uncharacterized protein n=1 Tax=Ficus carica TaxID=3494 RepID=A0AA88AGJ7_FICCA|nr:hypothetical protein TIFTF001_019504 [Ficus carica]